MCLTIPDLQMLQVYFILSNCLVGIVAYSLFFSPCGLGVPSFHYWDDFKDIITQLGHSFGSCLLNTYKKFDL